MTRKHNHDRVKESTPAGGLTYEQIGRQLGITKQGVRKIERRAIRKIKRKLVRMYGVDMNKIYEALQTNQDMDRD